MSERKRGETRCEFSDLPADICAHCLGHADELLEARRVRDVPQPPGRGWIPAEFPGRCTCCREPWKVGELIRRAVPTGWHGPCCAGDA